MNKIEAPKSQGQLLAEPQTSHVAWLEPHNETVS
jgi:hypothetical protein